MTAKEVDILVIGSGAGALTAAIVAHDRGGEVLIVEKDKLWGGTSASSGGGIWIPCSPVGIEAGLEDSPEEAFHYIKQLTGDDVADDRIKAFIKAAPEMLTYMHDNTQVRYQAQPYADYHTDLEGAKLGYRMHEPIHISGKGLGKDYFTMQPTHPVAMLFGRIAWIISESYPIMTRGKGWRKILAKMFARYLFDWPHRFKTKRDSRLTMGNALMGRLKMSLNERNVPLLLNAPMKELIEDKGVIKGAIVEIEGKDTEIRARKGVIMGAGGFERSEDWRKDHLPEATPTGLTASIGKNTGDAQRAGQNVGAKLDIMDTAWWAPGYKFDGDDRAYPMFVERSLPGCMIVNQKGERYMNEAASYHVTGKIMAEANQDENPTLPSWFVFDNDYRRKYSIGPIIPKNFFPDWILPSKVKKMLLKAPSLEALAEKMNVPAAALKNTAERMGQYAESGKDEEFNRGGFAYDLYYGDHSVKPNPCLGKIETGPFYALPIYPSDIGTKGGMLTTPDGQVVDQKEEPISGLYAVGNSASSVMGRTYPGAGSVLGPSMTFGYLAARHAMGAND